MSQKPPSELSLEELASRTGQSSEHLEQWRSLGLIGAESREGFDARDVHRVRLIRFCLGHGVSAETIARAEQSEGGFLRRYVEQQYAGGIEQEYSVTEAAAETKLSEELIRRLWEIVVPTDPTEPLDPEDLALLRGWKVALDAGLPEEALLQLVRVYADSLGRVAEAETRLFHYYVHERLKDGGLSGMKLVESTEAASQPMRQLIEPALLYFHRKGMAAALREDMLVHLAEYAGSTTKPAATAQMQLAFVFLDLASFTSLTESMGDVAAAQVVARFSELVREVVNRHQGRVVERIGDAFMLAFAEPQRAVACALEIELRTREEAQFPAIRGGIHFGPVLYREGGYVGTNVNIASRVADQARRHEILVTAAVRKEVTLPDVEFVPLGKRRLKGLAGELELFEARTRRKQIAERAVDPVCGMELTPEGVAARLSIEGEDVSFCSESCLRLFVESRGQATR